MWKLVLVGVGVLAAGGAIWLYKSKARDEDIAREKEYKEAEAAAEAKIHKVEEMLKQGKENLDASKAAFEEKKQAWREKEGAALN